MSGREALVLWTGGLGVLSLLGFLLLRQLRDRDSRGYRLVALAVRRVVPPVTIGPPIELPSDPLREGVTLGGAGTWVRRGEVDVQGAPGFLAMEARTESVWWMNRQGPFVHVPVAGNVDIRSQVSVRKSSDRALSPDREWQFGGIMLRHPDGDRPFSLENYVFVVIGHRRTGLQLEYKSTRDGVSEVHAMDWAAGDAELRLRRAGTLIEVLARPDSSFAWRAVHSFSRPDLPRVLQAGLLSYAFSEGRGVFDLRSEFRGFTLQP